MTNSAADVREALQRVHRDVIAGTGLPLGRGGATVDAPECSERESPKGG